MTIRMGKEAIIICIIIMLIIAFYPFKVHVDLDLAARHASPPSLPPDTIFPHHKTQCNCSPSHHNCWSNCSPQFSTPMCPRRGSSRMYSRSGAPPCPSNPCCVVCML